MSFIRHLYDACLGPLGLRDVSAELGALGRVVALARPHAPRRALVMFPADEAATSRELVLSHVFEWTRHRRRGERGLGNAIATVLHVHETSSPADGTLPPPRIDHSVWRSGIVVPWVVDVPGRLVHAHANPVSVWPPVWVHPETPLPGLRLLRRALDTYDPDALNPDGTELDVLFCGAPSAHHGPLDLAAERDAIARALADRLDRRTATLTALHVDGPAALAEHLRRHTPRIVHVSAHGTRASLIVAGSRLEPPFVPMADLLRLLDRPAVQLVVLAACYSADSLEQALQDARPPFSVVAMHGEVTDMGMQVFVQAFYAALADGHTPRRATQAGREALQRAGTPDVDRPAFFDGPATDRNR